MQSMDSSGNVQVGGPENEPRSELEKGGDDELNITPLQDSNGVNWSMQPMPGMEGPMSDWPIQGQPRGMLQMPGQTMVPVWTALPAEGGDGTSGQSYNGGQMAMPGNGNQQQQYGNGGPQAMAVPYGWRPMIGVMMAPPNRMPPQDSNGNMEMMAVPYPGAGQQTQPVAEDGSWQVKNTFLTYSSDTSVMYPLRRVNSANGVLGSYMDSQDEPWMG
jgi:hypothetical protein